jgi:tetrahydromethanopterin S-methyltransferase subunit A
VDEFVTFVVHDGVGLGVELGLEEAVAHLAGDVPDVVVVVAETEVDGHLEAVGDRFRAVEARGVREVEVVVGGGIVVEVVADEEDLFDGGVE